MGVGQVSYGQQQSRGDEERKPVDIKSKRTRPVPVGDSTGYALVGEVILYHNGSVITCDSMVRYSDRQMTCFGNVIINKDDTYIYGDRVEYSRDKGEARVFSPLIKVLNEEATLYTYNLLFNTADNIGEFYGGGTFTNGTNLMEAERGYFYADLDEVVGVDRVEMKNESYQMKSDSVNYNSETEIARYFTPSVTWKDDSGEILFSNQGEYHNKDEHYIFRHNAYVLGEQKEMWADTVDYRSMVKFIELKHNAQIRDEEHKSIVFGNYGNYDDTTGDTFLTKEPVYLSYGDSDGNGTNDTIYMRSDSMYLYLVDSLSYCTLTRPDSATLAAEIAKRIAEAEQQRKKDSVEAATRLRNLFLADSLTVVRDSLLKVEPQDSLILHLSDSLGGLIEKYRPQRDSLATDSLATQLDTLATPTTAQADTTDQRIMLGLRNVELYRNDFQGLCDSMLMFTADSTSQLHQKVVMWNELNQITAERADVYTQNQKPKNILFSEGKPLMSSEIDTTRYNQVAGKTIEAFFDQEGVMYKTDIVGNANTYYYMIDDEDGAVMGFLVAQSADMTFNIEDNTVVGIIYRGDPVYSIYPMDKIPDSQPQRMPEFVWHAGERPTAESVMGRWIINPTERKRYENMRRPQFPITYSIERHRESLVESGGWVDRTEDISDRAKEFIEKVRED